MGQRIAISSGFTAAVWLASYPIVYVWLLLHVLVFTPSCADFSTTQLVVFISGYAGVGAAFAWCAWTLARAMGRRWLTSIFTILAFAPFVVVLIGVLSTTPLRGFCM